MSLKAGRKDVRLTDLKVIYMAAWSSSVTRLAHNQEVVGSNPTVRNHYTQNKKDVLGGRRKDAVVLYTDLLFQLPPMRSERSMTWI